MTIRFNQKLFYSEPSPAEIDEFREWSKKTGQPEFWPRLTVSPAPTTVLPVPITTVDIDRHQRPDGNEIPCSLCSPDRPKFLHNGKLCWYPDERVVRLIGPECIKRFFGENEARAWRAAAEEKERKEAQENFLTRHLPSTRSMSAALERDRVAIIESQRLYQAFRASPKIQALLRSAEKKGGYTAVQKNDREIAKVGPRGFGGSSDETEVYIGVVYGGPLFRTKSNLIQRFEKLKRLVLALPTADNEEEAFDWVCENEGTDLINQAVNALRAAALERQEILQQINSVQQFFEKDHIDALTLFARSKPDGIEFQVSNSPNGTTILYCKEFDERVRLLPDFVSLSSRGVFPELD